MFRVNPDHTGVITSTGSNPVSMLLWNYSSGSNVFSSPAVVDKTLYAGNEKGEIFARSAITGEKIWNFTAKGAVWSSPAVHNNVVWIGSRDQFYALNAITGEQLWSKSGSYYGSATIKDGIVYFGGDQGYLYAIDENTREEIWYADTQMEIQSTPAVDEDTIYIEGERSVADFRISGLKSFYTSNGTKKWDIYPLADKKLGTYWMPQSSPCLENDLLYIGTSWNNRLDAIYPSNGSIKWSRDSGGYVFSSPAVDGNDAYIADFNGNVRKINAATGGESWSVKLPKGVFSSPIIIGNYLYLGCDDGNLYSINT
ncbi:MAG: PQQ-binding-like beta-propeller repeat protein [Methanomicrobiales archaeon]|nr:PQQ-binding-like beta-propeller repeat protein [Methanomicrobiales archaeon]